MTSIVYMLILKKCQKAYEEKKTDAPKVWIVEREIIYLQTIQSDMKREKDYIIRLKL